MKRILVIIIPLMISLSACGGGGEGGGTPTATYGTLTLSGSGTNITGTQFQAAQSTYATGGTGNQYAWVSDDGKALTVTDYGNGYAGVELEWETGNTSYYWYNTYTTGVTVGASSVRFNNVTISGHLNTTNSLTLNGTLNY